MNPAEDQKCAYTRLIARMCMKSFSLPFKSGWNYPLNVFSSSPSSHVDLQTHFFFFFFFLRIGTREIKTYWPVTLRNDEERCNKTIPLSDAFHICIPELIIPWKDFVSSSLQAILTDINARGEFWQALAKYLRARLAFFCFFFPNFSSSPNNMSAAACGTCSHLRSLVF